LIRNGAAVSRTTYAALFAVIGTTYGAGNGTTTFNVPNALTNGYFDRAGTPDGVNYADSVGPHTHTITPPSVASEGASGFTVSGATGSESIAPYSSGAVNTGGGVETVPVHQKYLPIIKY
jgi:phage-related tail fiber protein